MFSKVQQFWILLTVGILETCVQGLARNWDYTFLRIDVNSSNKDVIDTDVYLDRINRNLYGISGTIEQKEDVGDDYFMYIDSYRSKSGVGEFFKLPYSCPNDTIINFARTTYRQLAMKSFEKCSNVPKIDKDFRGPLPAFKYWYKNCTLDADNFPPYVQVGYYKIIGVIVGPLVTLTMEVLFQVETI